MVESLHISLKNTYLMAVCRYNDFSNLQFILLWWNEWYTYYYVSKNIHVWFSNELIKGLLNMWQNRLGQKYTYINLRNQFWWFRKSSRSNFLCSMATNIFWVIITDNSLGLFWAQCSRACLIHPLVSTTNTTKGKSEELSIDLKEPVIDLNKSGKSSGAVTRPKINCTNYCL